MTKPQRSKHDMMVRLTEISLVIFVICGLGGSFGDKRISEEDYYASK